MTACGPPNERYDAAHAALGEIDTLEHFTSKQSKLPPPGPGFLTELSLPHGWWCESGTAPQGRILVMTRTAAVLVHGLFSSADTWKSFKELASTDPELAGFSLITFEYPSPKYNLNPLRRIPDFDTLAQSLQTFLDIDARKYDSCVLVSHSQGGIIIQRYLANMVNGGKARDLEHIRRIVMFACPNAGSELLIIARQGIKAWRHPQEAELRPLNEAVARAHRTVLERIVYARETSATEIPIPIIAYAGESDNIVPLASALGSFPNTGVITGDHFSIIQADSLQSRSYLTFKASLLAACRDEPAPKVHDGIPQDFDETPEADSRGSRYSVSLEYGPAPTGWDARLNPVVSVLASALADPRKIRTIVMQSGLELSEIDPDGTPYDRWQSVFEQASELGLPTVDKVLHLALSRSSKKALHDAARLYWQQRSK